MTRARSLLPFPSLTSLTLSLVIVAALGCTKSPPEPPSASSSQVALPARTVPDPANTVPDPANGATRDAASTGSTASTASATPPASNGGPARCIRPTSTDALPAQAPAPAAACPTDPAPMKMATARLSFPDSHSARSSIEVELANTPAETARGLMYRRAMPADHGMLFDLKTRKVQAFWMRNTCIPLDMMFVDEDGTIVGILEQVPVLNEEERTVGCPSRYVLETNAGFARKHGIKAGQKVKLP